MDTIRRPSRAQTNQKKAQEQFKKAQDELKKAGDILKKSNIISELEKHIIIALNDISIVDVTDIVEGLKQDITDNLEEFNDVQEDIPDDVENISDSSENTSDSAENISDSSENISDSADNISDSAVDTSEDEYTEVSDIEGPIDSGICDEIVDLEFSEDGQEANKQLVKRLLEEQDLYFKSQCTDNKKYYYITKDYKELTIINFSESRYQYGLLTTNKYTPPCDIVNNWEKFGRNQAKSRKFDFKGKNIEEVVQMIHNILG